MKKCSGYRRRLFPNMFLSAVTAGIVLAAGCGNQEIQQNNSDVQMAESQGAGNQETENQNSQGTGSSGAGNQNSQGAGNQNSQGAGNQNSQGAGNQNSQGAGNQNSQGAGNQNMPAQIKEEEAKQAALQHAGLTEEDVTFLKVKLEYDDGQPEYGIEFVTGDKKYEYEIRGLDGAVLENYQEPIEQVYLFDGVITIDEAKEAVLNYANLKPEQVVYTKIELEEDDGITQYEIEFYVDGREYSGKVNAATGEVLELEMD